jgi:hypothetical protein
MAQRRLIVAFRRDEQGDWIAELDCGHERHVRHDPPMESHTWVLDEASRRARIGAPIECGRCA